MNTGGLEYKGNLFLSLVREYHDCLDCLPDCLPFIEPSRRFLMLLLSTVSFAYGQQQRLLRDIVKGVS